MHEYMQSGIYNIVNAKVILISNSIFQSNS